MVDVCCSRSFRTLRCDVPQQPPHSFDPPTQLHTPVKPASCTGDVQADALSPRNTQHCANWPTVLRSHRCSNLLFRRICEERESYTRLRRHILRSYLAAVVAAPPLPHSRHVCPTRPGSTQPVRSSLHPIIRSGVVDVPLLSSSTGVCPAELRQLLQRQLR